MAVALEATSVAQRLHTVELLIAHPYADSLIGWSADKFLMSGRPSCYLFVGQCASPDLW